MTDNDRLLLPSSGITRRNIIKAGGLGLAGLLGGASLLAACGDDDDDTSAGGDGSGGGGGVDVVKAHLVSIGPSNDNGWSQEHFRGFNEAKAALGDKLEIGFTPDVGFDASTTQLFEQLVADGNNIIFANTEYTDLLKTVSDANPDVFFAETNGHAFTSNLFGYYLAHETTAYLMGVAAGLLTPNAKIGYIGAFPTATLFNDVNGLLLGARSVNPSATVQVVQVNTFFDPQAAAEAADALLSDGVEFLFGVMDEPTFLQKAEEAGVWTGYWNLDYREAAPTKYVNNFDLSALGTFYTEQCQAVLDGTWAPSSDVVLLDCPLGAWGDEVPQDVQDQVDAVAAQIASGELQVYAGPLVDTAGTERVAEGESLDSKGAYAIDFAVEGVTGV
ncbi:MAG: BMP family ABC transporter substrate-binding protein [Acidimicrobiales bacterium]|nr:BMP family ABC transporter substrate-binding protein [Acidimicrobiales bacterium]